MTPLAQSRHLADVLPIHIVVAEDDMPLRMLLRHQFTKLGYQVTLCEDGEAAWRALQPGEEAEDAAILVSDWMMPHLDGPALCRRVRAQMPERFLYILLLTARTEHTTAAEASEAGADDVLSKMGSPAELALRLGLADRIVHLERRIAALESARDA